MKIKVDYWKVDHEQAIVDWRYNFVDSLNIEICECKGCVILWLIHAD